MSYMPKPGCPQLAHAGKIAIVEASDALGDLIVTAPEPFVGRRLKRDEWIEVPAPAGLVAPSEYYRIEADAIAAAKPNRLPGAVY